MDNWSFIWNQLFIWNQNLSIFWILYLWENLIRLGRIWNNQETWIYREENWLLKHEFLILFHERKLNISCSFNPKFSARIDEDINSFPLITLRRHLGIFYLFCRGVKWALILKELNWNKPKINLNIDQYSKNIIDFCDINSFWILF